MKTINMEFRFFETPYNIISLVVQQYQQSEESLREDVTILRKWMESQIHLPEILDDKKIQNFLILNKFSIERAKKSIDKYYTLRTKIPDIFENVNPMCANMEKTMDIAAWVPLQKLTQDMCRVSVFKILNKNLSSEMEPHDLLGLAINIQEVRLTEDVMFADVIIFDIEGITFGYVKKLTPSALFKMAAFYEIYSIPAKQMYIVNSPKFIANVTKILKILLKPKLFDRIVVCEDSSILAQRFPKELLPKDYGGEGPSVLELHELWKHKLDQHQDRFDHLDTLRVNEALRPQELENDEVLGFHGNFKKLDFD